MGGYLHENNIIRFMEEAISFMLEYKQVHWVPPVSISELTPMTVPLFTPSIGSAITHFCMEDSSLEYELESDYDFEELLRLPATEAGTHIRSFIGEYMNRIPSEDYIEVLHFISFIGQLFVFMFALELDSPAFVCIIIEEAVYALHSRYPYHIQYRHIVQASLDYNAYHRMIHEESEDEGFFTAAENEGD
ncbi:hypothetical protein NPIL_525231 [Nephila pilipes]|uniref:Uncharacterized protein n=1 Tax=Nephila pilipes TaxID=299642 RepID=A0A8X6QGU4_NEPPI|nr:hypothetical protein NPIL_525231 [Nephila pilipes]